MVGHVWTFHKIRLNFNSHNSGTSVALSAPISDGICFGNNQGNIGSLTEDEIIRFRWAISRPKVFTCSRGAKDNIELWPEITVFCQ